MILVLEIDWIWVDSSDPQSRVWELLPTGASTFHKKMVSKISWVNIIKVTQETKKKTNNRSYRSWNFGAIPRKTSGRQRRRWFASVRRPKVNRTANRGTQNLFESNMFWCQKNHWETCLKCIFCHLFSAHRSRVIGGHGYHFPFEGL